jgi:Protein phosphatase 2C
VRPTGRRALVEESPVELFRPAEPDPPAAPRPDPFEPPAGVFGWPAGAPVEKPPGRPADAWDEVVLDRGIPRFEARPTDVGDYVPDLLVDGWATADLTVRLASTRGYAHRYDGRPRQDDAVVCRHEPSGAVLVAVADGVSAAPHAHRGARWATRAALRRMLADLDRYGRVGWEEVLAEVNGRLEAGAATLDGRPFLHPADVIGTTLVSAVVTPRPDGTAAVDLAQMGDSGAWTMAGGRFRALLRPKTAEGAELVVSAVSALPSRSGPMTTDAVTLEPGQVLLLGTDGFGDPLGDGTGQVGRLFAAELSTPPRPLRFAHLLDFSRETFDDDRALVAVWGQGRTGPRRG